MTAVLDVLRSSTLAVSSSDGHGLIDSLDLGHGNARVSLDAAGAALVMSGLRSRGGCRRRLILRSFLGRCRRGSLRLVLAGGRLIRRSGLVIDNVGGGVVSSGGLGRGSRGLGGSLGLLLNGCGAGGLSSRGLSLLGGLGSSVNVLRVDAARKDGADVDALFLLLEDRVLVGRAREVASSARVVDGLALGLPQLAALAASDGCRVEALLCLLPALLARRPAALLGRVVGNLLAAPVAVLDKAAGRLQAIGLSLLAGGCTLDAVRAQLGELGAWELIGRRILVVDVEAGGWLVVVDVSRDGDSRLGNKVAVALEEDLSTASVELRVTIIGGVKSEKLGTGEVVAALQTDRKLDVEETVVGNDLV